MYIHFRIFHKFSRESQKDTLIQGARHEKLESYQEIVCSKDENLNGNIKEDVNSEDEEEEQILEGENQTNKRRTYSEVFKREVMSYYLRTTFMMTTVKYSLPK